jgi:hypothetical protein
MFVCVALTACDVNEDNDSRQKTVSGILTHNVDMPNSRYTWEITETLPNSVNIYIVTDYYNLNLFALTDYYRKVRARGNAYKSRDINFYPKGTKVYDFEVTSLIYEEFNGDYSFEYLDKIRGVWQLIAITDRTRDIYNPDTLDISRKETVFSFTDYDATISEDIDLGDEYQRGIKKGTYNYHFAKPYKVDDVAYVPNLSIGMYSSGMYLSGNCYFNKSRDKMMFDIYPDLHINKQYFFNKKSN